MPQPRPAITSTGTEWLRTSNSRIFLDAHTPDWEDPAQRGHAKGRADRILSAADPEGTMELLAEAGVDSVILFAKCQYGNAYYPTKVGRPHSALGGRDLFGEGLEAAHRRGIHVIAYFSNMWDTAAAARHPDWMQSQPPGHESAARWPALCLLSGYRQLSHEHVRELASAYPIDGLWSDILTVGPCRCGRCDSAFRERFGAPIPTDRADPGWLDLVHFSQDLLRDYMAEQKSVLRSERPDAAFVPNFFATTYVDASSGLTTSHLDLADIGSGEGYTDWHGLAFPGFAAAYMRAGVHERPAEVLTGRFVHTWDFTLRTEAQMRYEAFLIAARGVCVTVDDQPYADGAWNPEVYRRLTPVFDRIQERAPFTASASPLRFAALYASQTSRDLESLLRSGENPTTGEGTAQYPASEPRPGPSDLIAAVTGTYRALVEAHLPVDFLDDRPASLERLDRYRVIVLPDVFAVSEDEVAALTRFVSGGGGLLVTGAAGTMSATGDQLAESALSGLLGVDYAEDTGSSFPYLHLTEPGLRQRVADWPLPHYGRFRSLSGIGDGASVLAEWAPAILETDERSTYWHNNQPAPSLEAEPQPAIVERRVGAGRVVVCAPRLGNAMARLGHEAYRELIAALVERAAGGTPPVGIVGGHRNTELVLWEGDGTLVAHLVTGYATPRLDLHPTRQPAAIEDVASIARLTLRVPGDASRVTRVVRGEETELTVGADGLVDLTNLDDWETVVIRR
jgi:Hypothetical glycosyl hydrolase 6/Beta-galactosidase trimerisation domain